MKLFEWLEGQCYADHPEVHEALVTETRHFGVLLEIPRLQIKGLVKSDKLPGGRWVYEAFASRWQNDHGSVLCAGLRVPVIPVKVDREQQWADFASSHGRNRGKREKRPSPPNRRRAYPAAGGGTADGNTPVYGNNPIRKSNPILPATESNLHFPTQFFLK